MWPRRQCVTENYIFMPTLAGWLAPLRYWSFYVIMHLWNFMSEPSFECLISRASIFRIWYKSAICCLLCQSCYLNCLYKHEMDTILLKGSILTKYICNIPKPFRCILSSRLHRSFVYIPREICSSLLEEGKQVNDRRALPHICPAYIRRSNV